MVSDGKRRWFPAYVGLGSNLQRPARQLEAAIDLIAALRATQLIAKSSLYRSAPFGGIEQPDFVNAAVALLTHLSAYELLAELQTIERIRGRERDETRWGPRVLDLDLLVYSSQTIVDSALSVPHPGIAERNFVLLPLREIAPDLSVPGLGPIAQLPVNSSEPAIEIIC